MALPCQLAHRVDVGELVGLVAIFTTLAAAAGLLVVAGSGFRPSGTRSPRYHRTVHLPGDDCCHNLRLLSR